MGRNVSVSADMFAVGFGEIISGIESGIDSALAPAVKHGCNEAKKETVSAAAAYRWPKYPYQGWSYEVDKSGAYASGEVGNERRPGLVHLLEKGHAKVGGGATTPRPHVANGYEAGAKAFEERLMEGVDRALSM